MQIEDIARREHRFARFKSEAGRTARPALRTFEHGAKRPSDAAEPVCPHCQDSGFFTLQTYVWDKASGRQIPAANGPFRCACKK